ERALKKKYLCVRFAPRNDALDAVTDLIVLGKQKRPPKGYTSAGDIDGMVLCFKQSTIPESYGRLTHSQSTDLKNAALNAAAGLYPSIGDASHRHSTGDLDKAQAVNAFTIRAGKDGFRGIDGVPFKLSARLESATSKSNSNFLPDVPRVQVEEKYAYNFNLERSILA
ncbi:hypothetical protein AAVH_15690, partial [Aphelenchoides avenae]